MADLNSLLDTIREQVYLLLICRFVCTSLSMLSNSNLILPWWYFTKVLVWSCPSIQISLKDVAFQTSPTLQNALNIMSGKHLEAFLLSYQTTSQLIQVLFTLKSTIRFLQVKYHWWNENHLMLRAEKILRIIYCLVHLCGAQKIKSRKPPNLPF